MARVKQFRQAATVALADIHLGSSLENATGRFRTARSTALQELPDSDGMRNHFKKMRAATIANLAHHLQTFEKNAQNGGVVVHWAADAAEAQKIIVAIAQKHHAKLVTKSKSMATEEIHLNEALETAGITPVETDLGEWIIQLAGEGPSHIVAPAIHKTRRQVADLFEQVSGRPQNADDIPALTAEARRLLREKFLQADIGISGGNIAVAESGSIVLVTNEGNGRLVTSLPPVHIALVGIEKVAPTWDDAALWLSLLARSATGQPLSIYTSIITGPRRPNDLDGPQEVHIVLLDNGRSRLVGTKYAEILQCIRCGACLNICPVYRAAGGHAYNSPYSGPIGAVISPLLFGLEGYSGLPQASSLCGACQDVCPARIDLPRMLLALRADSVAADLLPRAEAQAERSVAWLFGNANRLSRATNAARLGQKLLPGQDTLPVTVAGRKLPRLAPKSFRQMWADGEI